MSSEKSLLKSISKRFRIPESDPELGSSVPWTLQLHEDWIRRQNIRNNIEWGNENNKRIERNERGGEPTAVGRPFVKKELPWVLVSSATNYAYSKGGDRA